MPRADGAEALSLPIELKRRAMVALRAPELYETPLPTGFTTLARLWHYEGKGSWRAWSVSSRRSATDASALRIRRVVWDRVGDYARHAQRPGSGGDALAPLLTFSEARFPPESWSALLQEVAELRVQLLIPDASIPPGRSKSRFGLAYLLSSQNLTLEWWDAPPEPWKELAEWADRARDALDEWLRR